MISQWPLAMKVLLVGWILLDLFALGLYHLMTWKVNRKLDYEERIPHTLYWGGWKELRNLYKGFYPRGWLYSMTLMLAIACFATAVALAGTLWWRFLHGK